MAKESSTFQIDENRRKQMQAEQEQIRQRVKQIKHQILVLSGKGGVGKSTVAVNLAISLSDAGNKVGLLDIDIHGPSIPKILNLETKAIQAIGDTILPVEVTENLKVMSIGFLLRGKDDAVIWRGPMKYKMIKQFLPAMTNPKAMRSITIKLPQALDRRRMGTVFFIYSNISRYKWKFF